MCGIMARLTDKARKVRACASLPSQQSFSRVGCGAKLGAAIEVELATSSTEPILPALVVHALEVPALGVLLPQ